MRHSLTQIIAFTPWVEMRYLEQTKEWISRQVQVTSDDSVVAEAFPTGRRVNVQINEGCGRKEEKRREAAGFNLIPHPKKAVSL